MFLNLEDVLNFTSPGFPWQYPPSLHCQWYIFADDNMVIVLRIESFDLERRFDYLTIGDGKLAGKDEITRLTGHVTIRAVTSGTSAMWMVFSTDSTGQMSGFYLQLEQILRGYYDGMFIRVTMLPTCCLDKKCLSISWTILLFFLHIFCVFDVCTFHCKLHGIL